MYYCCCKYYKSLARYFLRVHLCFHVDSKCDLTAKYSWYLFILCIAGIASVCFATRVANRCQCTHDTQISSLVQSPHRSTSYMRACVCLFTGIQNIHRDRNTDRNLNGQSKICHKSWLFTASISNNSCRHIAMGDEKKFNKVLFNVFWCTCI